MRAVSMLALVVCLPFATVACGEDNAANTGNEVVEACSNVICPPGTTRFQDSSAEGQCSGSGSLELLTESGEVSAQCMGSGECLIICLPPEPCCSGEKWTADSYSCDTPCAAAACADELPKCSVSDGDDVVLSCADHAGNGVLTWGESENCSAEDKTCAVGAGGAFCAECDEDADCDDGDPCTTGETCDEENFCQAGAPVNCDDGDPCNGVETCDSDTALGCTAGTPLQCDDGNPCNGIETCDSDTALGCAAGTPLECDDDDPCNGVETCDSETLTGCVDGPPPACDDGDACNGVETCDSETLTGCVSGTPVETDDGIACTADACDAETGAVTHTPDHALCDDSDPCTDDACVEDEGCSYNTNTAPCDDELTCTVNDTCDNGTCSGIQTSYQSTVEGDYGAYAPVAIAQTADDGLILFHMGVDQTVHATRYGPLGDTLSSCQVLVDTDSQEGAVPLSVVRDAERIPGTDEHVVIGEDLDENVLVAIVPASCTAQTTWFGESELQVHSVAVAANGSMAVVGWQNLASSKSSFFLKLGSDLSESKFVTTDDQALRRVRYLDAQAADGGGEGFVAVGSNLQAGSSCTPSCFGYSSMESSAAVTRWSLGGTLAQTGSVSHFDSTDGLTSRATYPRDVIPPVEGGSGYVLVGQAETPGAEGALANSTYAWVGQTNLGLNQLEWSQLHGEAQQFTFNHRFQHVAHNAAEDGYVVAGTRTLDYQLEYHDIWTAQLSSSGDLTGETLFGGGGDQALVDALTLETGLGLAGNKTEAQEFVPYAAWLIRTDLAGMSCSEP